MRVTMNVSSRFAGNGIKRAAIATALIIFLFLVFVPRSFSQSREIVKSDDFEVKIGGYLKNLTTYTYSSERRGFDNYSKIRLKLEATWKKRIKATLHYEIAMLNGESLKDEATRVSASGDPDEFLDSRCWSYIFLVDIAGYQAGRCVDCRIEGGHRGGDKRHQQ